MDIASVVFFDIEVNVNSKKIENLGLVLSDIKTSSTSINYIKDIFLNHNPKFVCRHNCIDYNKSFLVLHF